MLHHKIFLMLLLKIMSQAEPSIFLYNTLSANITNNLLRIQIILTGTCTCMRVKVASLKFGF